jgi:hypothetical protein
MDAKQDMQRFAQVMAALGEMFDGGGKMSAIKMELYFQALKEFPIEHIETAAMCLIKNRVFASLPKPAEIIAAIPGREAQDALPLTAWGSVMAGLESGREPEDPQTREAIRRVGGWHWLQQQSYDELHWIEKRFIEHYDSCGDSTKALPMATDHDALALLESMKGIG